MSLRASTSQDRSLRDPRRRVELLLTAFRLLEAAGACEILAGEPYYDHDARHSADWWSVLAARTRSYRAAVYNAPFRGLSSIEEWATLAKTSSASMELEHEMERLRIEYEYWLAVPGGRAYLAWLTALVATAEMDGARALNALRQWSDVAREFVDVPKLKGQCIYSLLQGAADSLDMFLPLPCHAMRDVRRFAFLPPSLRSKPVE